MEVFLQIRPFFLPNTTFFLVFGSLFFELLEVSPGGGMVDTYASDAYAAKHVGSSPILGTKIKAERSGLVRFAL